MARTGRPRKEINEKLFENLCAIQCTEKEICSVLECCENCPLLLMGGYRLVEMDMEYGYDPEGIGQEAGYAKPRQGAVQVLQCKCRAVRHREHRSRVQRNEEVQGVTYV